MNIWHILLGLGLIVGGGWLTVRQIKAFADDVPDSLGGNISLLICGVGIMVMGIIEIVHHI